MSHTFLLWTSVYSPPTPLDFCSKALTSQRWAPLSPTEKSSPSEHGSSSPSKGGAFIEDSFPWVPTVIHPAARSHTQARHHTKAHLKDSCQDRRSIGCSNKEPPNLNGLTQQNFVSCSILCGAGWSSRTLTIQGLLTVGLHISTGVLQAHCNRGKRHSKNHTWACQGLSRDRHTLCPPSFLCAEIVTK